MNEINPFYCEMVAFAKNNKVKFSLTEKTLIVKENNKTIKLDLNKITNVRIIKHRELSINYMLVILILLLYHFLNKSIEGNFISNFLLNSIASSLILTSLYVKKYTYSVLINTINLNFIKLKKVEIYHFFKIGKRLSSEL